MTNAIKETLLAALKLQEASVRRQQTAKPKFSTVWDAELGEINTARIWVSSQKTTS